MNASPQPPLRPRQRQARWLIGGGITLFLLALALLPSISLTLPGMAPCIFHGLTGLPCPLCGGTRAASALLHGDLAYAWHLNALAFPALGLLGCIGFISVGEALLGRPWADWSGRWREVRLVVVAGIILLFLWWGPHMWQSLRDPRAELLDLRNPIARRLHDAMRE